MVERCWDSLPKKFFLWCVCVSLGGGMGRPLQLLFPSLCLYSFYPILLNTPLRMSLLVPIRPPSRPRTAHARLITSPSPLSHLQARL